MAAGTVPHWLWPRALFVGVLIFLTLVAGLSIAPLRGDAATPIYACVQNSDGQVFLRGTCLSTESQFNLYDRDRPVRLTVMTADGKLFYRRAPSTGARITVDSPGAATLRFCYQQGANQRLYYFGSTCPAGWRYITVAPRNRVPNAVNDAGTGYATSENTAFTTANVLANDTDPNADPLVVSDYNRTSAGGAAIGYNGNGTFTYTPGNVFNGLAAGETLTDQFAYVARDKFGGTDQAIVSISVAGVNDAPTANDDADGLTVSADGPGITFNVIANDTDPDTNDVLTISGADATSIKGALNLEIDGEATYDPNGQFSSLAAGQTATETFTYTIADGQGGSDTATVTITVQGTNGQPDAVNDAGTGFATNEDAAFDTANVLTNDTDPDGDTLSVSDVDDASAGGAPVSSNDDGTFAYDPRTAFNFLAAGQSAIDAFTYTVSDGNGGTDTATVSVVVAGRNDGPTATDDGKTASEDGPAITFNVLTNDTDPDTADILSVTSGDTSGLQGALTLGSDGAIEYDPSGAFEGLATGETTTDTFTYTISDGQGGTATATVTITIEGKNDAPDAVNDSGAGYATDEDSAFDTPNVLINDTDVDGDTLTVSDVDETSTGGASLSSNDDGTFAYEPSNAFAALDAGEQTTDTFTYTVSDGNGGTDTATVSIAITGVNDRPTADDLDIDVAEDGSAPVTLTGADVDGDALTFSVVDGPANGTLSGTAPNLTYTPDANYTGADSFTYVSNDGDLDSAEATVSITVGEVNDDPVATNDTGTGFTTNENTAFTTADVLANDTDVDGDTLSVDSFDDSATTGLVTDNGDGTFDYDPDGQLEGLGVGESTTDTFTYTVSDGRGGSDSATVTITITGVNDNPTAVADTATTGEASATTVNVLANDSDPDDNDDLAVASVDTTDTQGLVEIAADGLSVSYDPNGAFDDLLDGETDTDTFTYTISDGNGGTDTATVTVTIEGSTNIAPAAADTSATTNEDQPVVVTLTGSDAEGDDVTFAIATGPTNGDLGTISAVDCTTTPGTCTATVTYTPDANANGADSFTYVANDGQEDSAPATASLTVNAVNDAPAAVAQSVSTNEDTARTITLSGTDADDDALTFAIGTGPSRGTLGTIGTPDCTTTANTCTATVTYTPDANANGADSFTFTVDDGPATSPAATVSITVNAVNDLPVATGQSVTTNEDTAITITLAATDADVQALTFAISTAPTNGTLGTIGTPSCAAGSCTASVTYTPAANTNGADSFTFTVNDGTATSAAATVSITVTAVNDAPLLAGIESAPLTFTEGNAPTAITASLTVSDVDSATLTGASVVITGGFATGQDVLAFTSQLGITGSYNPATGVMTLDGDASPADYQTVLRSVTYGNASQNPTPGNRTVVFQVDDGAAVNSLSNNATRTIAVTAVNDAPVNTVPTARTVDEDTNLVFSTANGNAISIADIDAGTAAVKLSLDVANGTLTFPATTGLTFVDSTVNGGASVHVTGTIASINTALNGLTYRGAANYNVSRGPESLSITTNDQGNTGTGGALSDIDSVTISVTAANDAPVAAARAFGANSIQSNMQRSIDAASGLIVGATDNDASDGGFTLDLDVGTVNGVAQTGGTITTTITGVGTVVAEAETGAFTFNPAPGVVGNVSFPFTVCDNGNPTPSACSTAVNASFTIVGPVIWFVNPAATNGDGRLSSPFNTLAGAAAVDAADHRIFIYSGAVTGSIVLNSGEWLIGQGVTGAASFDALMGITPPGGTLGRPAVATGSVTTSGTITLATNARIRALAITTTAATGMTGTGGLTGVDVAQTAISTGSGTALSLNNVAGTLDFTNVSKNGSGSGIELTNVGASVSIATGGIQNTSIVGVSIVGGNGTFTYPGTVSNSLGRLIQVNNRTGGSVTFSGNLMGLGTGILVQNNASGAPTITFSGATKSLNTANQPAVTLSTNTGAAVNFTGGGLAITTSSGAGFSATGGGTVVVPAGTNPNTITSTTGTALNVTNTTIGTSGLAFRSISANGAANGIVLNNTGTTAGLTVAGTGTANSGGTIQSTTGDGIALTNTRNVSFTNMRLLNTGGSGVEGTGVVNFTFTNGTITNSGTAAGVGDSNIAFNKSVTFQESNVSGTVTITGNTLATPHYHGVEIFNWAGLLTDVNVSGNTLTAKSGTPRSLGSAIGLIARGSNVTSASVTRARLDNNTVQNGWQGGGIQAQGGHVGTAPAVTFGTPGSATDVISISGNTLTATAAEPFNAEGIIALHNHAGQANFRVNNNGTAVNPIGRTIGTAISSSAFGDVTVTAEINNNFVAPGNSFGSQGIGVGISNSVSGLHTQTTDFTVTITGNTVSQTDGNGILAVARDAAGLLKVTIENNTVAAPLGGVRPGIRVDAGSTNGDNDVCLDISGNTSAGSGGHPGLGLRKQGTSATVNAFAIEGMTATGTPGVENYVNGLNPAGNGTLLISAESGFTNCSSAP